ncbi:winged helix-turn-helix domain-containing protein [Halorientalis litorea]|jgi:predicted transcriptional regulator|uniref:winged helix-turn-helix domain-containing protein n=1 Tax=Halorientalis litorea TaxID=2931977 RepID=UPI001FF48909|nr:winged helix-turn-helix domain-containing protein [Halorientalis litorea]
MSANDGSSEDDELDGIESGDDESVRERIEEEADRAVERFDESVVDLLSWILDTETRARIYVSLRQSPHSTSDEIADETGLYPSTVREALAELHEERKVERRKRESGGAGNNPYEYTAIPPSDLVSGIVGDVQSELNTLFNLDSHLDTDEEVPDGDRTTETDDPVSITVTEADDGE